MIVICDILLFTKVAQGGAAFGTCCWISIIMLIFFQTIIEHQILVVQTI